MMASLDQRPEAGPSQHSRTTCHEYIHSYPMLLAIIVGTTVLPPSSLANKVALPQNENLAES
jgi:hypothetical protein